MDDDDDRFLYGDSDDVEEVSKPQPIPLAQVEAQASSNGVVAKLEAQASAEGSGTEAAKEESRTPEDVKPEESNGDEDEDEEEQEEEDSDDDVEIIMEPPSRSLDFRQRMPASRQATSTTTSTRPPQQPAPTLTTEYTPRERNAPIKPSATPQPTASAAGTTASSAAAEQKTPGPSDSVDTNSLPIATAPPSHPSIDPSVPGTLDGRSILEVDLSALAEKPWRRPGSDISDWFNYGFDEISWEAYCFRRREVGEVASMLKANVLNFAGMPEDQLAALPAEIRTMVMAGASAMMNSGNAGPAGMLPAAMNMNGAMMNPMMDMGPMMGPMMHEMDAVSMAMASRGMQGMDMSMMVGQGMGGQGMGQDMSGQGMGQGMGGQMGGQGMGGQGMGGQGMGGQGMGGQGMGAQMGGQGMGGQMGGQGMGGQGMGMGAQGMSAQQGMGGQGMGGQSVNNGALSGGVAISSAGTAQPQGRATPDQAQVPGMMGMGMNGEFPMQQQEIGQQMYPPIEPSGTPAQGTTPTRNVTPGQFRNRPIPQNINLRGRGAGYVGRGRGGQVLPVRPASPLPPNVPTGPRNKNKYKDIDGSAPAVDGLDYGGGKERTTPPDHDDRSSRKRRSSPNVDDGRSSKRR